MTSRNSSATVALADPPEPDPSVSVENRVRAIIRRHTSALIALSGGVDSSIVAVLAKKELGNAQAATGISSSLPEQELNAVKRFSQSHRIPHHVVSTYELSNVDYTKNSPDRCFFCKDELYGRLATLRSELGLAVLMDGTTAEDLSGHRPGHRASKKHGVLSPLVEAGAKKKDVRRIAERLGLKNASRPSSPCLSSRIAYGVEVSETRLNRVEKAENFLHSLGFKDLRVRLHDSIARIEVPPSDFARVAERAEEIDAHLRALGFVYVTVDLRGLRSGSLLEILRTPDEPKPTL